MNYIERMIRQIVIASAAAMVMVACGGMDAEVPAMAPTSEEASESEEASQAQDSEGLHQSSEDQQEELEMVAHPFSLPSGDPARENEPQDNDQCARSCFKFAWCGEGDTEFGDCLRRCEDTQFSGVIWDSNLQCFDEARNCLEVGYCENEIEACTDVCGVHAFCGVGKEIENCQSWCVEEIWAGRLDWSVHGCIDQIGRSGACEELSDCGLSEPHF